MRAGKEPSIFLAGISALTYKCLDLLSGINVISVLVTTSKALVTRSDALVTSSVLVTTASTQKIRFEIGASDASAWISCLTCCPTLQITLGCIVSKKVTYSATHTLQEQHLLRPHLLLDVNARSCCSIVVLSSLQPDRA